MHSTVKRIVLFCLLAFLPTWGICLYLYLSGMMYVAGFTTIAFAACMFMPAIASILTRLFTKQGFSSMLLKPHFRGNMGRYVLAALLPAGMIALGAALYYLCLPQMFDPTMQTLLSQLGPNAATILLVQSLVAILLGWLINIIPAMGEELGWRGYLLPQLTQVMSNTKAILLSGAIWGLWHAPMIVLGHNYGIGYPGYPYLGILLMTVFCMAFGAFLSYLTLKVKSAVPAAMAHSALNATAALATVFVASPVYNAVVGPCLMGAIPVLPVIGFAVWFCIRSKSLTLKAPLSETEQ